MRDTLNRLINHESITTQEAKQVLIAISRGEYNQSIVASFLTVYMMRSITIEELKGFRDALLELCIPVNLEDYNTIDLCGTGGDGKNTFNISTLASFVTAGAGVQVTKHGNYGVSSTCGSSNVMEYLGVKFSNKTGFLKQCLDKANICVLHAPLFHPAMKQVAPVRRELGVKTFFNMLGPLVNPCFPKNQMVGVFSLELLRLYTYFYQKTDKNFTIVHSLDGYDEISLTSPAKVVQNKQEIMMHAEDFGVSTTKQNEILGGHSIATSAKIFMHILKGQGTDAQNQVVCANAGLAIATVENTDPKTGYLKAMASLKSGKALKSFETLINLSKN